MSFQSTSDFVGATEDYGQGYYVGTVYSNSDPLGLNRIQATVPGIYDPTRGPVPWIAPLPYSPFGFGTSAKGPYGTYGVPPVGSVIKIELQNGDVHKPLYTSLYTLPNVNSAFPSTIWGFQDPDGNIVQYDTTNHTYRFVTYGGAIITISQTGQRTTTVNGDTTNSDGAWQVNVTGNAGITASGNVSVDATGGNMSLDTSGNFAMTATGTATYTASAHNFVGPLNASSTIGAQGDITDDIASGNGQTMADMRQIYNEHIHTVIVDGSEEDTSIPIPQVP